MRSRIINPGFFQNQELAKLGPYAQILFAGLWCMADRDGRLKDCPQLMKAMIFPYYDITVEQIEQILAQMDGNFIERYALNGHGKLIFLPKFSEYQHVHPHEAKSKIPANSNKKQCDDKVITMSGDVITMSGSSTSTSTSTSIPPVVPQAGDEEERKKEAKKIEEAFRKKFAEEIVSLWNRIVADSWGYYQAFGANKQRIRMIHARMIEDPARKELSWWEEYFRRIERSDIMRKAKFGESRWADLTWCLYPGNMTKVLEGRYDNATPKVEGGW